MTSTEPMDFQSELDETQRALREVTLMIEQSQGELGKITQRNTAITSHLQQLQKQGIEWRPLYATLPGRNSQTDRGTRTNLPLTHSLPFPGVRRMGKAANNRAGQTHQNRVIARSPHQPSIACRSRLPLPFCVTPFHRAFTCQPPA